MLASLAQSLELFSAAALARLFVVGFATHFLAQSAALAQLSEPTNRLLNGLSGTNP
jgi:hypothetical protein